jgi:hypothetical protein
VPVNQPTDHKDDKDSPEYAADPDRSALTVIAAAVKPKPASKYNHEQHDDQNQFHRFVFHQFIGNPCQTAPAGSFALGRSSQLWSESRATQSNA